MVKNDWCGWRANTTSPGEYDDPSPAETTSPTTW
jgi:hypothetical protein